jgi:formate hydrogenlyase subunit 3/multisubunit Na+/H+ antiporter MnhD subunit
LTLLIAFGAFLLFMRLGMAGVRNVVDPEVANEMAKVVRQVIDIFLNPVKLQAGILFMVGLVAANVLPRVGKNNEEEPFAEEE